MNVLLELDRLYPNKSDADWALIFQVSKTAYRIYKDGKLLDSEDGKQIARIASVILNLRRAKDREAVLSALYTQKREAIYHLIELLIVYERCALTCALREGVKKGFHNVERTKDLVEMRKRKNPIRERQPAAACAGVYYTGKKK